MTLQSPRMRALALFTAILALDTGCAATAIDLYSRSAGPPPPLGGRTVAVLPTLTEGKDVSAAVASQTTSDLVFADRLGSVQFIDSRETTALLSDPRAAVGILQEQARGLREGDFAIAKASAKTLIEKGEVAGTDKKGASPKFSLRTEGAVIEATFPSYLDPALFEGLEADYVLASIVTTRYWMYADIFALFGILPFMFSNQVLAFPPFTVFALYDLSSGQRVWESQVGSVRPVGVGPAAQDSELVDPRGHPVVGAAYLLTDDALGAIARAIGAPPP